MLILVPLPVYGFTLAFNFLASGRALGLFTSGAGSTKMVTKYLPEGPFLTAIPA